jgi:hypothetical protein
MHQLIAETGWSSNYSEIPGKGHWWDTVMTTKGLQEFYQQQLRDPKLPSLGSIENFEIVVADPGTTGSKFGIRVLYIEDPGQLGKLRVTLNRDTGNWRFEPENIMAFEIDGSSAFDAITIHDTTNSAAPAEFIVRKSGSKVEFRRGKDSIWKQVSFCLDMTWSMFGLMINKTQDDSRDPRIREVSQFGGLDALLKTKSRFTIAYRGLETGKVALQISRNLHQYYYADSDIVDSLAPRSTSGHIITIAIGAQLPPSIVPEFPIKLSPKTGRIMVLNSDGKWETPGGSTRATSAVFLRPLDKGRLELVVWGDSIDTIQQAARLVPMLTGTGQPDFIIIGEDGRWKGTDAAYMGFFDVWWKVSRSSVLT